MKGGGGRKMEGANKLVKQEQKEKKKREITSSIAYSSLSSISPSFASHAEKDARHYHDRPRVDDDECLSPRPEREEGCVAPHSPGEREVRHAPRRRRCPRLLVRRLRSLRPDPRRRRRGPPELAHRALVLVHQGHHGGGAPGGLAWRARGRLLFGECWV